MVVAFVEKCRNTTYFYPYSYTYFGLDTFDVMLPRASQFQSRPLIFLAECRTLARTLVIKTLLVSYLLIYLPLLCLLTLTPSLHHHYSIILVTRCRNHTIDTSTSYHTGTSHTWALLNLPIPQPF
jgi:hypothetical protein